MVSLGHFSATGIACLQPLPPIYLDAYPQHQLKYLSFVKFTSYSIQNPFVAHLYHPLIALLISKLFRPTITIDQMNSNFSFYLGHLQVHQRVPCQGCYQAGRRIRLQAPHRSSRPHQNVLNHPLSQLASQLRGHHSYQSIWCQLRVNRTPSVGHRLGHPENVLDYSGSLIACFYGCFEYHWRQSTRCSWSTCSRSSLVPLIASGHRLWGLHGHLRFRQSCPPGRSCPSFAGRHNSGCRQIDQHGMTSCLGGGRQCCCLAFCLDLVPNLWL